MKEVNLTRGKVALVDDADFGRVSAIRWQASPRRDRNGFYAVAAGGVRMHRFIMGVTDSRIVDHRDGNGLDNRRSNLRVGTQSQNCVNRRHTPGSGLRGTRFKKGRWQAYMKYRGKQKSLGYFDTEQEAHEAYIRAASKQHGDWMPLPSAPPTDAEIAAALSPATKDLPRE